MAFPSNPRRRRALLALASVLSAGLLAVLWFAIRSRNAGSSEAPAEIATSQELETGDTAAARDREATKRVGSGPTAVSNDGFSFQPGVRLSGPGRLAGRVLERTGGAPVAGAKVELLPLPPAGQEFFGRALRLAKTGEAFASRVDAIAIAASGSDGGFTFEGVRCGTYYVQARGARSVPDGVARVRVAASGDGGPIDVWVRAGGRVLGIVVGPDDRPVSGAAVALTLGPSNFIESLRRGDAVYLETASDAEGRFVIAGAPASAGYDLTASGGGFALSHVLDVEVRAGADTEVVLRTRRGGAVEGRVVSRATKEDGEPGPALPLAGAHVAVVPRGLRDLQFAEELLHQTHSVTDASGRYRITGVPPGEFDVVGVAEEHVPAKGPRVLVADGGTSVAQEFELPRGPMVRGRVLDSSGTPVAGASVRWNSVDFRNFDFDFTFAPLLASAIEGYEFPITDADGRFTAGAFAGDAPYRLDVFKNGFEPGRHSWDPAQETGEITVRMERGGAVEGIVIDSTRLVPVPSFTIETNDRVETEVSAPGNLNPFSGGVLVENPEGRFALSPVKSGEKIQLRFRAPGYLEASREVEVEEGGTLRGVIVELAPGGTVLGTVVDPEGEPVAGAQVFALPASRATSFERRGRRRGLGGEAPEVGQMPPGFRDFAAQLGLVGDDAVVSRPDGTFTLTGLEAGSTVVLASHRDFVIGSSEPVTVAAGEPVQTRIELSRGGGLRGHALDRFGRPVARAIVVAVSPANFGGETNANGGGLYQARTNELGEYRIERMVGGGYFVLLTRGDEALNLTSFLGTLNFDLVTVPDDEVIDYDILDTSSGATRVFGRVLDDGKPVERGNVTAMSFESESMLGVDFKIAPVRPGGVYEFVGLAPGEHRFQVDVPRDGRGNVRITADIPDVPEFELDLRFPEGSLAGRVVAQGSLEPVAGAEVTIEMLGGEEPGGWLGSMLARESSMERGRTDEAGAFAFTGLGEGRYRLAARPPNSARSRGDEPDAPQGPALAASEPLEVELGEDQTREGLEIALAAAVELAGKVVDSSGEPVEDALVLATRLDLPGLVPERATSGEDGSFRFRSLGAGRYELVANADGFAETKVAEVEASPESSRKLEIVMREGIAVTVRVVSASGQPASGASGRLAPVDGSNGVGSRGVGSGDVGRALTNLFAGKGVSDSTGTLQLGVFGPGEYRLQVQRGLERAEETVTLSGDGPVELRIRLE